MVADFRASFSTREPLYFLVDGSTVGWRRWTTILVAVNLQYFPQHQHVVIVVNLLAIMSSVGGNLHCLRVA
jgi:hypothetical protein